MKGYIRIILNLKYSYLKIKMPEQVYTFPFLHGPYNSLSELPQWCHHPALPKAAGTRLVLLVLMSMPRAKG